MEECAPPVGGWPPGTGTTRPPPCGPRGAVPDDQGGTAGNRPSPPPPLPPPSPPPPAHGWPGAGRRDGSPAPPRGGRGTQGGGTPQPQGAQPRAKRSQSTAHSLPHYPLPTGGTAPAPCAATERRQPGMRRQSGPHWSRPGKGGGADHARRPPLAPPLPATPTHRRPTRPRLAPTATRQPRLNVYTQGGCAGEEWGQERGPQAAPPGQGGGEQRRTPPSSLPPTPPLGLRATKGQALHPLRRRRGVPPPPEGTATPGGGCSQTRRPRAPALPSRLLPRGSRQAGEPAPAHKNNAWATPCGSTRRRTGAVWEPRCL